MAWWPPADRLTSGGGLRFQALFRYRKKPIVLLVLVALIVAQAGAGLHALQHFGKQGDPLGLPGQHVALCPECASFVPLENLNGAGMAALEAVILVGRLLFDPVAGAADGQRRGPHFRSRAPPC